MSNNLKKSSDKKAMQQPAPQFQKNYSPTQDEDEVGMVTPDASSEKDYRDCRVQPALSENDRKKQPLNLHEDHEGSGITSQILNAAAGLPEDETLEDALIDLYLSVKIRSNEEIDTYNEDKLIKERTKLQQVSPFMILEYIKTSIEILMNMKMEDAQARRKQKRVENDGSDVESVMSGTDVDLAN